MTFKKGDRVKYIGDEKYPEHNKLEAKNRIGTIVIIGNYHYGVEFDENINGHNLCDDYSPEIKSGHGWWCTEQELQLIKNTMPFFEKLEKYLKTHDYVVVQRENGDYKIFNRVKDEDGDYCCSLWHATLEKTQRNIVGIGRYTKGEIEDYLQKDNWQIIDACHFDKEAFEVGEEVMLVKGPDKGEKGTIARVEIANHLTSIYSPLYEIKLENGDNLFHLSHTDITNFIPEPKDELTKDEQEAIKMLSKKFNITKK